MSASDFRAVMLVLGVLAGILLGFTAMGLMLLNIGAVR